MLDNAAAWKAIDEGAKVPWITEEERLAVCDAAWTTRRHLLEEIPVPPEGTNDD
jgi:hypothetical protein